MTVIEAGPTFLHLEEPEAGAALRPHLEADGITLMIGDPCVAVENIHDFHGGALKLVGDRQRGVLIGATLVTPRAGEIVGELVLAIKLGTPLNELADVIHPFPAFQSRAR